MIQKLVLGFALFALAVASGESYRVTLFQPSVVGGTELKPGDYRLNLKDAKVVLVSGKQSVEAAVKVESSGEKFPSTRVRYANSDGKYSIREICLGGTRTKLVFQP